MVINKCPDCGKTFHQKVTRCTCGWIQCDLKELSVVDYRCQFREFGKQCDEDGTVSHALRGDGVKWYCFEHWYGSKNNKF